jgi:hypothetical protein
MCVMLLRERKTLVTIGQWRQQLQRHSAGGNARRLWRPAAAQPFCKRRGRRHANIMTTLLLHGGRMVLRTLRIRLQLAADPTTADPMYGSSEPQPCTACLSNTHIPSSDWCETHREYS